MERNYFSYQTFKNCHKTKIKTFKLEQPCKMFEIANLQACHIICKVIYATVLLNLEGMMRGGLDFCVDI